MIRLPSSIAASSVTAFVRPIPLISCNSATVASLRRSIEGCGQKLARKVERGKPMAAGAEDDCQQFVIDSDLTPFLSSRSRGRSLSGISRNKTHNNHRYIY